MEHDLTPTSTGYFLITPDNELLLVYFTESKMPSSLRYTIVLYASKIKKTPEMRSLTGDPHTQSCSIKEQHPQQKVNKK